MQERNKTFFSRISTILILSAFIPLIYAIHPAPFQSVDCALYDSKMRMTQPGPVHDAIIHVDIDDKAIREFGLWPWDRVLSGRLVQRLTEAGVSLIVFDIVYAAQGASAEGNQVFFSALSHSARTICATVFGISLSGDTVLSIDGDRSRADLLYERAWQVSAPAKDQYYRISRISDAFVPLPDVLRNARDIGHIKSTADPDGVHRNVALIVGFEDRFVPCLSLAALAAYYDCNPKQVTAQESGYLELKHAKGTLKIPVDSHGRMLIRWHEPWKGFPHYSASDILRPGGDASRFAKYKDKIAIVGVTGTGSTDMGLCPVSSECPLSRVHSNALNTMLTEDFLWRVQPLPFLMPVAALLAFGFGLLSVRLRFLYAILLIVTLSVGYLASTLLLFMYASMEIPTAGPLFTFVFTTASLLFLRVITAEREAARVSGALQRYVSPQVLESIVRENKEIDLSTKRKELTILFADIEGFSTISETVDVEYLEKFLNEFFDAMTRAVFHYHGTVNKFLGDGLLSFFGEPVDLPNHALSAVMAACRMQDEMNRLNKIWKTTGIPEFERGIHIRIGINTGLVVVGNIGSTQRMEYTVLGSAVNLASRLQGLARPDGILITSRTRALAGEAIVCSEPRTVKVRGIDRDVVVYDVSQGNAHESEQAARGDS
jgi:adenylate cyclase